MKVCFYASAGKLGDTLRRSVQEALGHAVTDLNQNAPGAWRDAIAGADLVVVDITGANAAACYLVGLAIGKRVVLLAPIEESIPAIFEDRGAIVHRWNLDLLKTELRKLTTGAVAADANAHAVDDDSPAGKFQQMFGDLLRAHGYVHRGSVEFDGSTFIVREQDMDLPLVQEISNRAKSLNVRVRLL